MNSLTKAEYEDLILKDIEALAYSPVKEHQHIKDVLLDSIRIYYEFMPAVRRLLNNCCKDADAEIVERILNRDKSSIAEGGTETKLT